MAENSMRTFSYSREGGRTKLVAGGDVLELAAECGYMIQCIHSSLMRKDPEIAGIFRTAVRVAIVAPGTPTWDVSELSKQDSETIIEIPKSVLGRE